MKKQIPWLILDAAFLVVFNVCFFLIIAGAPSVAPSIWVSYGFIHLSYILLLCTPLMVRQGNQAVADYRRPLYYGTWTYFLATLVVNVAFILVSLNSSLVAMYEVLKNEVNDTLTGWLVSQLMGDEGFAAQWLLNLLGTPISVAAAWIVNIVMLGAVAVYLAVNTLANNDTAEQQERHEQELKYVKTASARLKYLVDHSPTSPAMRSVETLYDDVMCSPLRSNEKANGLERQLLAMLGDLESAVQNADEAETLRLCKEMQELAARRNRIVNMSN